MSTHNMQSQMGHCRTLFISLSPTFLILRLTLSFEWLQSYSWSYYLQVFILEHCNCISNCFLIQNLPVLSDISHLGVFLKLKQRVEIRKKVLCESNWLLISFKLQGIETHFVSVCQRVIEEIRAPSDFKFLQLQLHILHCEDNQWVLVHYSCSI